MKRVIDRAVKACEVLAMAAFLFGCSMQIDSMDRGASSSSVNNNVRSLMNRADAEQMLYMGGAVLYSPKDSNANQLMPGAVIATRIGKVEKTNLGADQFAYKNSKTEYELGFISVDSISKSEISFTYFKFPSADSNDYVAAGNFSLAEGESADLNGDGIADVSYSKPAAGRKGYKSNMWLNFLCDAEAGDSAAMFSIIPMQYERSVYPNGLLGINTKGQYIVNKYNVGTNSRSIVSSISYGDYVLDTEENTLSRYVGAERSARSAARAIGDAELEAVESTSMKSSPSEYEFKANEFTDEYDIKELLAIMPSGIVKESFEDCSIAENVSYLNSLIRGHSFISDMVEANPGETADEVREQLARAPISGDVERIIFGRHMLALMYPENCPDVNLMSQTLSNIIPWMYIDFGDLPAGAVEVEEDTSARAIRINEKALKKSAYNTAMDEYRAEARGKHQKEEGKNTQEYIDYEVERDAILKYFSKLHSYNFAPLFATLTEQKWLKDIVKSLNLDVNVGIAGEVSFANANPSISFQLGILLRAEFENALAINIYSTSLFAGSANKSPESMEKLTEKFNEKFPDGHYTSDDVRDYIDTMSKVNVKDELGFDSWMFDASEALGKSCSVNALRPTNDSKNLHKAWNPIPQLPFVVTFDAQFDILFKAAAVVEANHFTAGCLYMAVLECRAGINWGFRDKFLGVPIPTSFYCETYCNVGSHTEFAGFVGITSADPKDLTISGGARITICPIIELRGGVGLGYSVLGASADVTVGAGFDLFAPVTGYFGRGFNMRGEPVLTTELSMDAGFGIHGDVQFCLDPPLISAKRWNYDIPGLKAEWVWQIFRVRLENFEVVKKEGIKYKSK